VNFNNKKIKNLTCKVSSFSNSPTKHKRYRLPIIAILIITLILTSSFLVFFTDKLPFTSSTVGTKPNIPTINPPYTAPELLWKTDDHGRGCVYPVVLNEVVYSYQDYGFRGLILTALNVTNGDIIWQTRGSETGASSDINNMIYTHAYGLIAWNAKDGTIIWIYGGSVNSFVVVNDNIYIYSYGTVVALKAIDGTEIWNYTLGRLDSFSALAVANGIVYISDNRVHNVYALDALDGKLLWECTTDGGDAYSWMNPALAVANGIVYVADKCTLYALNATTGKKIWTYKTGGEVGLPVVEYGVVYVGSGDKKVYALNAQTGKKIWAFNIGPDGMPVPHVPTPAVADGVVYVTDNYCNDSGDYNGVLYALSAANGKKFWSYQIEEMILSHVIVDDKIYINTSNSISVFSTIKPLTST
jgi:outer membrane protein assembly factor BamB